jgi:hypothetical protein
VQRSAGLAGIQNDRGQRFDRRKRAGDRLVRKRRKANGGDLGSPNRGRHVVRDEGGVRMAVPENTLVVDASRVLERLQRLGATAPQANLVPTQRELHCRRRTAGTGAENRDRAHVA